MEEQRRAYVWAQALCRYAGADDYFLQDFWTRLTADREIYEEFIYYLDHQDFLCNVKIEGYGLVDLMIFQIDHFRAVMEQRMKLNSEDAVQVRKKRLNKAEQRIRELDQMFIRLYEDNVKGRISDERFAMMSKTYEDEQAQLKAEADTLRQEIKAQAQNEVDLESFVKKVRKYSDLRELTPYALRELVKGIYVEAPVEINGKRHQNIRIQYDFVGFIPMDELSRRDVV